MLSIFIHLVRSLLFIGIITNLTACNEKYSGSVTTPSAAGEQLGNKSSSKNLMKWSSSSLGSTGLNVFVSEDLINEFNPEDYIDELNPIQQMLIEWNNAVPDRILFNIDSSSDSNAISTDQKVDVVDYNDNIFGIYKHDDWFDDVSPSALAITQFFGKRINPGNSNEYLELIHADIIVNFKYFNFAVGPEDYETYDLPSVILHELGHFLGLNHTGYYANSVMVPYLDVATEKRELFSDDEASIQEIYGSSTNQLSAIRNNSSFKLGALVNNSESSNEEYVNGIIELQASGKCRHFINGKLVHIH